MDVPANIPTPAQLWRRLDPERRTQAARAFWVDDNATHEHAEVVYLLAQRIKFRLKSVMALPVEKKAQYLLQLPVSEMVAARLLVTYHLAHQRPMMGAFLDALGVAHEDGIIADEEMKAPSQETLAEAARRLAAAYPASDVSLYLSTLTWQDPETWGGLTSLPETTGPVPAEG
jgi:hypothetical protein